MQDISTQAIAALAASTGSPGVAALVDKKPDALPERTDPNWLCYTMDAKHWTDEYCRINPGSDWNTMIGWFANAIMAGYDASANRSSEKIAALEAQLAAAEHDLEQMKVTAKSNFDACSAEIARHRKTVEKLAAVEAHTVNPEVAIGGLQAMCVAASQESARGQGLLSDFDRGYLQGQFHVFKNYVTNDIPALIQVEQYIADLIKLSGDARALADAESKAQAEARTLKAVEAMQNAARYEWLRNPGNDIAFVIDKPVLHSANPFGDGERFDYEYRSGDELDAAIDAAIIAGSAA